MSTKYALVSVFNKTNIVNICKQLVNNNYKIISSSGTYKLLKDNINTDKLIEVSEITQFKEMLGGRVKTLHPNIHGGILANRDFKSDMDTLKENNINPIDMVIVNLYNFKNALTLKLQEDEMIEMIDIGGVALIRAGAKNYKHVTVITNPDDFIVNPSIEERRVLAGKAFRHTCEYDSMIAGYFTKGANNYITKHYEKVTDLKYGCNPYQDAFISKEVNNKMPYEVINGTPGYINYLDALYAWQLVSELYKTTNIHASCSYKHNSPAGVALASPLKEIQKRLYNLTEEQLNNQVALAYYKARQCDPKCSFGDFCGVSGTVDKVTAELMKREVMDGVIASDYTEEALEILKKKAGGRFIILKGLNVNVNEDHYESKDICGITLNQKRNNYKISLTDIPDSVPNNIKLDMILANLTLKYSQSNNVCLVQGGAVIANAVGQQSRVDCVKLACQKAKTYLLRHHNQVPNIKWNEDIKRQEKVNYIFDYIENDVSIPETVATNVPVLNWYFNSYTDIENITCASDAFFPFEDSINILGGLRVSYIIQPGGSIRDDEIKECCKKHNIEMVLTGKRLFLH